MGNLKIYEVEYNLNIYLSRSPVESLGILNHKGSNHSHFTPSISRALFPPLQKPKPLISVTVDSSARALILRKLPIGIRALDNGERTPLPLPIYEARFNHEESRWSINSSILSCSSIFSSFITKQLPNTAR